MSAPEADSSAAMSADPRTQSRWLWLAIALGLALRAWEACESSLWLDELHTLSHASLPTAGAVAESVRREYHTPLFFVAVHFAGGWEEGAWLRAIPVASSLLVFAPLVALARTSLAPRSTVALAALGLACLPYQVHYASELRPYAWFALFGAGAAWAAFGERGPRWVRFATFAACVLLGIWTHHLTAALVVAIGFARLFVRSPGMLPLSWLITAGAIGVAPSVPWIAGFAEKATGDRFEYQAKVGGYTLRKALVMEFLALPTRVFVPYLGALGGKWALVAKAGAAAFFVSLACALVAWIARWRRGEARLSAPLRALAIAVSAYFVLVTAASIWSWDRLPLQYYGAIAWALPIFAAEAASALEGRWRAPVVAAMSASLAALGVAQAGGHATEDMRRAVATARETGATLDRPIYTALLSQPKLFEHVLPYRAYGRDLDFVAPEDVPEAGESGFERPVVVLRRVLSLARDEWKPLLAGRRVASEVGVDPYLSVFVLEPER
jgi:hypothetical protein